MNFLLYLKTYFLSFYTTLISPVNIHNKLKFMQINEIWFAIKQDNVTGDYLEFGVFKGKSLFHSIRCAKKYDLDRVTFYGLDSFEGFPEENHLFYTSENFKTSYEKVKKIFNKKSNVHLIKGFFNDSLNLKKIKNIKNIAFAFIDCDIYESAKPIFDYLENKIPLGGFIMIDDYSSVDKNGNSIYKAFEENILLKEKFIIFAYYSNGIVFRKVST